jgi:hypothetical protein
MNTRLTPPPGALEAMEARLALRLAAALDDTPVPHDIGQRLRVAREQALDRARAARATTHASAATAVGRDGAATLGGGGGGWWMRLASVLPLALLVAGLVAISQEAVQEQVNAAAEIDAALLADDLPPAAYSDPGFIAFLKNPPAQPAPATVTQ